MAAPKRTQKEIAQRYRGNLDYLRKLHFMRGLRGVVFFLVVVASLGAALGYRYYGRKAFFSTGPISANHQRFADRCEVCHGDADPDLLKALHVDQAVAKAQTVKLEALPASLLPAPAPSTSLPAARIAPALISPHLGNCSPPPPLWAATTLPASSATRLTSCISRSYPRSA